MPSDSERASSKKSDMKEASKDDDDSPLLMSAQAGPISMDWSGENVPLRGYSYGMTSRAAATRSHSNTTATATATATAAATERSSDAGGDTSASATDGGAGTATGFRLTSGSLSIPGSTRKSTEPASAFQSPGSASADPQATSTSGDGHQRQPPRLLMPPSSSMDGTVSRGSMEAPSTAGTDPNYVYDQESAKELTWSQALKDRAGILWGSRKKENQWREAVMFRDRKKDKVRESRTASKEPPK